MSETLGGASVFRELVTMLVAINGPRCASFDELLAKIPGIYPADLRAVVAEVAGLGLLGAAVEARIAPPPPAAPGSKGAASSESCLPAPHPLDYDWRFTTGTADALIDTCLKYSAPSEVILLLGTPTVLERVRRTEGFGRSWILLEANHTIVTFFDGGPRWARAIQCDLTVDQLPDVRATVVIADPP